MRIEIVLTENRYIFTDMFKDEVELLHYMNVSNIEGVVNIIDEEHKKRFFNKIHMIEFFKNER